MQDPNLWQSNQQTVFLRTTTEIQRVDLNPKLDYQNQRARNNFFYHQLAEYFTTKLDNMDYSIRLQNYNIFFPTHVIGL